MQPMNMNEIELPKELADLTEMMARNVHEVWARERIKQGWAYGAERDDKLKLHPCLVPYEALSENEKMFDRNTSIETLKFILKQGFSICKIK